MQNKAASLILVGGACTVFAGLALSRGRAKVDNPIPLVTGKSLSPVGKQTEVGSFPVNAVLSPDGKYVIVTNSGFRQNLSVLNVEDGSLVSALEVDGKAENGKKQGMYYGLVARRDEQGKTHIYVSRGAEDAIAVYALDEAGKIGDTGKRFKIPPMVEKSKFQNIAAGIALSSDGSRIFVANNNTNHQWGYKGYVSVVNTADGSVTSETMGGYPFGVATLTSGPNADKKFYVTSERDAQLAVFSAPDAKPVKTLSVGANPTALLLDKSNRRLFVVNGGSDTISIVDTVTDTVSQTILLRPVDMRALPGATPTGIALSPDESNLYVTLADLNAVAVVDLKTNRVSGYIPTGWYPTSVVVSPDGKRLFVTNAKGVNRRNQNGKEVRTWGKYIQNIIEGTVSAISMPGAAELAEMTSAVMANNSLSREVDARAKAILQNPGIEHVIYIVKENRTYDQVLSDLPNGNGDPSLLMFGREVTPNQHALAERFVLLDNFYVCAEVSADGWNWSVSSMSNEYVSRNAPYNYSGRGRAYDYEGTNNGAPADLLGHADVAKSPGGYLWENAINHGVSYRNFGFFVNDPDESILEPDGKPIASENKPNKKVLVGKTNENFRVYDLSYADSEAHLKHNTPSPRQRLTYGANKAPSRYTEWKREFDSMVRTKQVPKFMTVRFGRDHTAGTSVGLHSPRAMVADNDYAVGQLVEAISKSPIWKKCAIFILEDDAQAGFDHVDAHRSIAFVISPFIKKATVDHTFHNTASMIRSMEILLGLPPMNHYDAGAMPFGFFTKSAENAEPYSAILPSKEVVGDVNKRTAYRAIESGRFSLVEADTVPDELLNDILWRSIKGINTPKPAIRYAFKSRSSKSDSD